MRKLKDLHENNKKFNENEGFRGDKSNKAKRSLKESGVMQSPQSQETKNQELTQIDAQCIRVSA